MCQPKATQTVTVTNPEGLHVRAASLVAKLVNQLSARVELIKGNQRVDCTDVLQMLSLCALEGDRLLLEATGEEADLALEALVELFHSGFAEDQPVPQHESHEGGSRPPDVTSDDDDLSPLN